MSIVSWFKPWVERIKLVSQRRWFRFALQGVILILCAIYLLNNLKSILSSQVDFHIHISLLVLATAITILAVMIGAFGFLLTLWGFGIKVKWPAAINIHLQSNLAKYIPGYAWQLIGKAYLTKQTGVSTPQVGLVMTIELAQLILAGLCLAVFSLPVDVLTRWNVSKLVISALPSLRVVFLALVILFPFYLKCFLEKTKIASKTGDPKPMVLFAALLTAFVGWLSFGYSFWLLGKAFYLVGAQHLGLFIFTLTASIILGLAIVIVPGSIGVRESIMVWLLGPIIGAPQAVIVAVSSRIVVTVSELISAFAFGIFAKQSINPKVVSLPGDSDDQD